MPTPTDETVISTPSGAILKDLVERAEHCTRAAEAAREMLAEVWSDAKAQGFDVPALKAYVARRQRPTTARQEREATIDLYAAAVESEGA